MSTGVTIDEVREALNLARTRVLAAGVTGTDVDALASTLAALELLNGTGPTLNTALAQSKSFGLPPTFAEWAADYNLVNHYDRFLAVVVHRFETTQDMTFTTDDISEMYRKARWERAQNPSDVIAKAAKRLYFVEADEDDDAGKKRWRLTQSGYAHFQSLRVEKENENAS